MKEDDDRRSTASSDFLNGATDWSRYRDPRNFGPIVVLTAGALLVSTFYRSFHRLYLQRIPQTISIGPQFWRKRSLFGRVTSVGDSDNFRLFHTPGGRLTGWGILPWRRVPDTKKGLQDNTVSQWSLCNAHYH